MQGSRTSSESVLRQRAQEALEARLRAVEAQARYPITRSHYEERLEQEIEAVAARGFAPGFLALEELVRWCREGDFSVGPGCGSAAASVLCWTLGATAVDPIRHGVRVERFLGDLDSATPALEIEVDDAKFDSIVGHVMAWRGRGTVCWHGPIWRSPMAALEGLGRSMQMLVEVARKIAEFRAACRWQYAPDLPAMDFAPSLDVEGSRDVARPGVVILLEPPDGTGATLTLGLHGSEATTLEGCVARLAAPGDAPAVDLEAIPLDDPRIYRLLCEGDAAGVLGSGGKALQKLVRELLPRDFEALVLACALAAPGGAGRVLAREVIDRRAGRYQAPPKRTFSPAGPAAGPRFELRSLGPAVAAILEPTHGALVFDQQVAAIIGALTGWDLDRSEDARRTLEQGGFDCKTLSSDLSAAAAAHGLSLEDAFALKGPLFLGARAARPRAHAVARAVQVARLAWLHVNYQEVFDEFSPPPRPKPVEVCV